MQSCEKATSKFITCGPKTTRMLLHRHVCRCYVKQYDKKWCSFYGLGYDKVKDNDEGERMVIRDCVF
mgnify:CR=1 FL=1